MKVFSINKVNKMNPVIAREVRPTQSHWVSNCTKEIASCQFDLLNSLSFVLGTRNDGTYFEVVRHVKKVFIILLLFVASITSFSQNTMQINNAWGAINDTVVVSMSVANDEEFISFQCDVILPAGFDYIPGSVSLSSRSVDHVVNVTNIENNTIRILSYSLNNTAFLMDSGTVAQISISTPSQAGDYLIDINNGIIGNAESVNILDSLIAGIISLSPIGVLENKISEHQIKCYPNPFKENITIQFDIDYSKVINITVCDIKGKLLSKHELQINNIGKNDVNFSIRSLLGNNPNNGFYFIRFDFQDGDQLYSVVKKIQLNK